MPDIHRMQLRALFFIGLTGLAGLAGLSAAGCSKPSEDDCRKAVLNLQKLRGLDLSAQAPDPERAVRNCRATGSTEMVKCLIAAKTAAEADACQKKS